MGAVGFSDDVAKPAHTIITGEGGTSPLRFKHVIKTEKGLRKSTPLYGYPILQRENPSPPPKIPWDFLHATNALPFQYF